MALKLAAERGYHGTTIALVAERSGLPVSSIYWHFRNKDLLLDEALGQGLKQWRAGIPPLEELPQQNLQDAIRYRFDLGARFITSDSAYVRFGTLLLLDRGLRGSAARQRYVDTYRILDSLLLKWWRTVLPASLLEDAWDEHFASVHIAFMEGVQSGVLGEGWEPSGLVDLVADGIAAQIEEQCQQADARAVGP